MFIAQWCFPSRRQQGGSEPSGSDCSRVKNGEISQQPRNTTTIHRRMSMIGFPGWAGVEVIFVLPRVLVSGSGRSVH